MNIVHHFCDYLLKTTILNYKSRMGPPRLTIDAIGNNYVKIKGFTGLLQQQFFIMYGKQMEKQSK